MTNRIIPSKPNEGLENYIIGSIFLTGDGNRGGQLVINQNLPGEITLVAGTKLNVYKKEKTTGNYNADYSVSVLLPIEQAHEFQEQAKKLAEEFNNRNK